MEYAEVAIVGGSLAGSFAAYLLGRLGYGVLLIDPTDVPPPKACGEGLSPIGKRYLEQSGLWEGALASRVKPYHGFDISLAAGHRVLLESEAPVGYAVPRRLIDTVLRSAAEAEPLVRTIRAEALSVERRDGAWQVRCRGGETLSSREIVLANGVRGRKLVGASSSVGPDRYGLVIRARGEWLESAPRHVIIENEPGLQFLLTPFDESRVNISILVERSGGSRDEQKSSLVVRALALAHRAGLRDIVVEDCRGAARIGRSLPIRPAERAYLVGDAAELFDPIGGMGMSHALVSASLAAESIALALEDPKRSARHWRRYCARRTRFAAPLRLATALSYQLNVNENPMIQKIVSASPRLSQSVFATAHRTIPIAGLVTRLGASQRASRIKASVPRIMAIIGGALIGSSVMARPVAAESNRSEWYLPRVLSDENVRIKFSVDTTWHEVHGSTSGITGKATLTRSGDPSAVDLSLVVPASKLDTGDSDRDEELRKVMAVKTFPDISLSASNARLKCTPQQVIESGSCADVLTADLTIRSTTKHLRIPITIRRAGEGFTIAGSADLRWADYEVEDPSIFLIAEVDPVVRVDFEVTLKESA